jgi:hypothetical protein
VTRAAWHATAADHGRRYVGRHREPARRGPSVVWVWLDRVLGMQR